MQILLLVNRARLAELELLMGLLMLPLLLLVWPLQLVWVEAVVVTISLIKLELFNQANECSSSSLSFVVAVADD